MNKNESRGIALTPRVYGNCTSKSISFRFTNLKVFPFSFYLSILFEIEKFYKSSSSSNFLFIFLQIMLHEHCERLRKSLANNLPLALRLNFSLK